MRNINIAILVLILMSTCLFSQQRNVEPITILTKEGESMVLYKDSYALVIGVNNYTDGWPKLTNAVNDAIAVTEELEKHGFGVELLQNVNSMQLKSAIERFVASKGLDVNNRLLFYFSGHGYSLEMAYGDTMGYIIPTDTPLPHKDMSNFMLKAIDMQLFDYHARRIQSKHALFIFDSCFSGSIFMLKGDNTPQAISYNTSQPVRQFITAGREDEPVPDRSYFMHEFIAALQGDGDLNRDGYITGTELGLYLQDKVAEYSKGCQHPRIGTIRDPRLDKGDFVFISPLIDKGKVEIIDSGKVENLRSAPDSLSQSEVITMIRNYNFFDRYKNETSGGFENQYEIQVIENDAVIFDKATGLMWQQGGSSKGMPYEKAQKCLEELNQKGYAGFNDWRLPTLEEAMSLMAPAIKQSYLYIDPVFDKQQRWIWTSDLVKGEPLSWVVDFSNGYCHDFNFASYVIYVRAVRSGQSDKPD